MAFVDVGTLQPASEKHVLGVLGVGDFDVMLVLELEGVGCDLNVATAHEGELIIVVQEYVDFDQGLLFCRQFGVISHFCISICSYWYKLSKKLGFIGPPTPHAPSGNQTYNQIDVSLLS